MARIYLLFRSTHETLKAEQRLQGAGVNCKVVMKPAGIKVDCGLAVRTDEQARAEALQVLQQAGMEPRGVYSL